MENISQINPYERTFSWTANTPLPRRKYNQKKKSRLSSGKPFYILSRLAHDTHQKLLEQDSSVRLCVYEDKEELFMDVVAMDKTKNIDQHFSRVITHDKLQNIVRQIHSQNGLVLDYSV